MSYGQCLATLQLHKGSITTLNVIKINDGYMIYTGSQDGTASVIYYNSTTQFIKFVSKLVSHME